MEWERYTKQAAMPRPERIFPLVLVLVIGLIGALPATASLANPDSGNGSQIFSTNCAACHMGGGNVIRASRTLSQADLQAHLDSYSQDHLEAIG